MPYSKKALALHKKLKGKIEIKSRVKLNSKEDLAIAYTPGVGAVSLAIAKNRNQSWELTNRGNMVAIVSDGTAVLGLGNIGPRAAMPVMEGKSAIFKEFANIDAIPLCIDTIETEEIIKFCKYIEPSFGGINLEDISAPRCFEILEHLEKELRIAVFHDDQDGTAIVTLAALINACKVLKREIKNQKIIINGAGAAGIAIARLLLVTGIKDIILVDSMGAIYKGREYLNIYKEKIAVKTNKKKIHGNLEKVIVDRDVFIGVSKGGILEGKMVKTMNPKPIIFAMANPHPEILPHEAIAAGAGIVGTGRSDYENQINNALVFPGIFRGLLDSWSRKITTKMKISVAEAIAKSVTKPTIHNILPKISDKKVVNKIANCFVKAKKKQYYN
ncbi:MAG: NADP-dependent malic enzyme [Patescibacteria group bacterium]